MPVRRCISLALAASAICVCPANIARADDAASPPVRPPAPAQATPPAPAQARPRTTGRNSIRPPVEITLGAGRSRFFGVDFTRSDLALTLPIETSAVVVAPELRIQPGVSDHGLLSSRQELGLSLTNAGIVRAGGGVQLAHTMVLRRTVHDPFMRALVLGDIAGLGIGVHADVTADIPVSRKLGLVLGGRALVDMFDGGAAYGASGFIGIAILP